MENETRTLLIPDDLCRRAGIGATYVPINNIAVFPTQKTIPTVDKPSAFASDQSSKIYNLRPDVILFKPILRKLVNEANGIFLTLQTLMQDQGDMKQEVLRISRQYRSIIRACLENLQDEITKAIDQEREELRNFITIFYSIECIWHLCEILFIDTIPGSIVLQHLLDWIRFHFPKYERNAATLLTSDVLGLETHQDYWETVIGSLLQGRVKVVLALLRQHSDSNTYAFQTVDQCLKTMPIYNPLDGVTVTEFNVQRKHWMVDVQSKIDAKSFASSYNLNLIMKLVVGNEVAWGEIQQYCETWYELLAAWLFYTEPTAKSFELGQYAKQCINKMSIKNRMKHLDRVLLAAMEFNIIEVIKEIQHMSENCWFATHFTDILYHSGHFENVAQDLEDFSSEKLREYFLIDYGCLLMGHQSLWQVGLSYLDHCPNQGIAAIELLLPRLSLDSERRTQKIIKEAQLRDLNEIVQHICKVQAMIFKNRDRLGNALVWALKSQDSVFVSYLSEKFLKEYKQKGELSNVDLLENLGPCILTSDRLVFLGKYQEFRKLYNTEEFKEAASLLVSLLGSKIVPSFFWSVLLVDTIPLLDCENLVLSSTDTLSIIQCLEDKEYLFDNKEKVEIIRLAAARNLARALLNEAQIE